MITPERIIAGESAVVSSTASNTGGQEGTYSLTLNLDGIAKEAEEVTLAAGGGQMVVFEVIKDTTGKCEVTLGGQKAVL